MPCGRDKRGHVCLLAMLVLAALLSSNACFAQEDEGAEAPAMDERDAYEVLGVNKRSTEAEIRKSFKEKSLVSSFSRLLLAYCFFFEWKGERKASSWFMSSLSLHWTDTFLSFIFLDTSP